ncbi:dual specificity mitogen-activated protein kinase kinase 5-like isoform X2 [Tubulanus polymorphus]|uniref:dual specificity mitogen-activated protein kinase kinase 5-like isoform X2 n=1 Tax=Tubulanus polymorphus TaxID=672921 RepID=UPI003DA6BB7D
MELVIRISGVPGGDMDWTVQTPQQLTFQHILDVIARVVPHSNVAAFEYEDEEKDRITVRTNEEMMTMISFYYSLMKESTSNCAAAPPLIIYPRVSKTQGKRNIHGLKVNTSSVSNVSQVSNEAKESSITSCSNKMESEDIKNILSDGSITESDLELIEILGTGNGGTVYKAYRKPNNLIMAVKVIPLDVTPQIQRQIISELEILYKCNSDSIISFFGAFFAESRISICTEHMDGGSLDRFGQIPESIVGRVAVSVVKGLQYLWGMKIMHRDVKPSNILVNTAGQVKLCDFGVSVQLINSIAKSYVGTNIYMAPERLKGEEYSVHSEVWSLGVSLFEMAVGKFPYEFPFDLMNQIVKEPAPVLPDGVFSDVFVNFVSKCMEKSPYCRPAPGGLLQHPFIVKHDDGNLEQIRNWILLKLQTQHTAVS